MSTKDKTQITTLGYQFFTGKFRDFNNNNKVTKIINTLNAYSYLVAEKDEVFKKALQQSSYLLPDGVGIVLAARILNSINIEKYAGYDLHIDMLKYYNTIGGKVFYFGSSETTLYKIKERVAKEFPNISVAYFSPPFKEQFTAQENIEFTQMINAFKPDVVFVGMTAPKQEKWIFENNENINTSYICAIGAVFDFYAGTVKRAPKWMIKLGLEWFYRLIKEPRRMWRRYLIGNTKFIYYILIEKLFNK